MKICALLCKYIHYSTKRYIRIIADVEDGMIEVMGMEILFWRSLVCGRCVIWSEGEAMHGL